MTLKPAMVRVNKKIAFCPSKRRKRCEFAVTLTLSETFLKIRFFGISALFSLLFTACASFGQDVVDGPNFGPLFDHFSLTLRQGAKTEAAGPLFGLEHSGTSSLLSVSPVFSLYRDSSVDQTEAEFLYPLLAYDGFGSEYRFHLFQVIAFAGGESLQGDDKKRTTIFPIYFRQKADHPDDNYTAIVPFYGRMKNRLFRDRVFFVMLPLYLQTEKRGMVTENYLFPFFHKRHGAGVSGWQFWPVVGKEHKEITTTTNHWGDQVVTGGYDKFMALWPFYFNNTLGLGTTNVQKQFVLLPFYANLIASNRTYTAYGFPLGFTQIVDREKKYEERGMPWPLIVFADGEGKKTRRVWPLFSQAKTPTLESKFYLWPVYKYNAVTSAPLHRERTRILFFLYSDLVERETARNTALRRRDFWPLFTWRKDHQDNERLQILSLLEPLLPNNKSIERMYSPVYSIYRQEKSGATGDRSQSLLWNLYRSERRGEMRRMSAFFGLFQREKDSERTRWRLLFIPFETGHAEKPGQR
jgi:hypothetical protein